MLSVHLSVMLCIVTKWYILQPVSEQVNRKCPRYNFQALHWPWALKLHTNKISKFTLLACWPWLFQTTYDRISQQQLGFLFSYHIIQEYSIEHQHYSWSDVISKTTKVAYIIELADTTLNSMNQLSVYKSAININSTYVRVWAANSYDVVIFDSAILPAPENALTLQRRTIQPSVTVCTLQQVKKSVKITSKEEKNTINPSRTKILILTAHKHLWITNITLFI